MSAKKKTIVNRVENSGLVTINLLDFYPNYEIAELDLKDFLFQELILKEKDFREKIALKDWAEYTNKRIAVYTSVEAVIPNWAFMLISKALSGISEDLYFGSKEEIFKRLFCENLKELQPEKYQDKRVILKGCNDVRLHPEIFLKASTLLMPYVRSLMYGEACSSVPIYKRPK